MWFEIWYLDATIDSKTQNPEPEMGTDRTSKTLQSLQVDGYRSGIGQQEAARLILGNVWNPTAPS